MTWTDIEEKWIAMTRRVQSDRPVDEDGMRISDAPRLPLPPPEDAADLSAPAPHDRAVP